MIFRNFHIRDFDTDPIKSNDINKNEHDQAIEKSHKSFPEKQILNKIEKIVQRHQIPCR